MVCTVDAVVDGDTIAVTCSGQQVRVRVHCIDAPEIDQGVWGRNSREHLAALTPRTLILVPQPTERGYLDRYGRLVAEVLAPDEAGTNLGMAQVFAGQAAVYPKYCADERYVWVEAIARRAGLGIWRAPGGQQTPWIWRHRP
jgi:endonuclease YncB( thermonuclease family)